MTFCRIRVDLHDGWHFRLDNNRIWIDSQIVHPSLHDTFLIHDVKARCYNLNHIFIIFKIKQMSTIIRHRYVEYYTKMTFSVVLDLFGFDMTRESPHTSKRHVNRTHHYTISDNLFSIRSVINSSSYDSWQYDIFVKISCNIYDLQ